MSEPLPPENPMPVPPAPTSGPPAMQLDDLTKVFDTKPAVDSLSLTVPAGSFFGIVGPNGAGKTTTLSMATGLLRPDRGRAQILGQDVWQDPPAAKQLMGVMPDGLRLFDRLSGRELLIYTGRLRDMPIEQVTDRCDELLYALGLTDDANKMVADYSAGMKKKISLASALIHAPRLLVLDEPFESVDPVSSETIRGILRSYVTGGGTVVFSSHVMELVESLCDQLAIVVAGRVKAAGSLASVRDGQSLQQRFLELVGAEGGATGTGLAWLHFCANSN